MMLAQIWDFLSTEGFQPHGMCLLWRPDVFWAHTVSDLVIALSYFSIPGALIYFAIRRSDLIYRWVLYLFGAFIVACGLTHIFGIWTMWVPDYGIEAVVKMATAMVSATVAITLWPLMPKLLALPSTKQLEEKNFALAREVTERESAETKLLTLNEELERRVSERTESLEITNMALRESRVVADQANKAKSEFLAMMSHELRTPLNAVIGFGEILRDEKFGPVGNAKYLGYARDICDSGKHLLDLINDILDLAKIEAGTEELREEDVDVSELMDSIVTLVDRFAHKHGVELKLNMPDVFPLLRADERKLKQILVNLLSNSIKFTPEGGKVTLKAWFRPESGYVFQVIDTGIGIDLKDVPKALSPFQQIDSAYNRKAEGTGLGLPLAKALAEVHGGSLDLQSVVGKGTVVTVRFPAERCGLPGTEARQIQAS